MDDAEATGDSFGEPAAEEGEVEGTESTVMLRCIGALRWGRAVVVLILTAGRAELSVAGLV